MRLQDQVAVVTGGGKGIGRSIALGLAAEGATVVVTSRTQADLAETVAAIEDAGGKALASVKDLTSARQVGDLAGEIMRDLGRVDILINNAGGYPSEMYTGEGAQPLKIWEWREEQWDTIIAANLKTAFLCTREFLPLMIKAGRGKVVNISSRMGRIASQMGAYAAAKAALIAMTKTAAIQAEPYGIQVNAVSPGITDTPGQRRYNSSVGQDGIAMADAESVVRAVLYLLCDAPPNMVGQSLDLFKTV